MSFALDGDDARLHPHRTVVKEVGEPKTTQVALVRELGALLEPGAQRSFGRLELLEDGFHLFAGIGGFGEDELLACSGFFDDLDGPGVEGVDLVVIVGDRLERDDRLGCLGFGREAAWVKGRSSLEPGGRSDARRMALLSRGSGLSSSSAPEKGGGGGSPPSLSWSS